MPARQLPQLAGSRSALFDASLYRLRVAGNERLQVPVDTECDRERGSEDQDSRGPANESRPRAQLPGHAAAGERDREQRHCRAERVREGEQHAFRTDAAPRDEHGDRGEDGPGAGDEDEPEARPEKHATAELASRPPCEPFQWAGDQIPKLWHEERRGDDE